MATKETRMAQFSGERQWENKECGTHGGERSQKRIRVRCWQM